MLTSVLGNGITETRAYRTDNLLTSINSSNTNLGNLAYTWDANKNKTAETITGVMSNYGFTAAGTTYDFEDRLTGFQRTATSGPALLSQSWSLSTVGDWNSVTTNGTAQTRTHGPTHELLTAGGQAVNTDVKGNMTLLPSTLNSQPLSLNYDADNKLRSVDVGNDSSVDVNYQYDALGRRVARTGTGGSVVYVQADQQTIADYPLGGAPATPTYRYVYASYIDEPVVRKGAGTSGTVHYYHRNQQYSIYAITDAAANIAERYAYTAYGQPTILNAAGTVIATSTISNRYTYTAREWDATVGLHHFRARWMSGLTGRFLTRDPIGYEGSEWSLYEFVSASALIGLDPQGLDKYPLIPGTNPGTGINPGTGTGTNPGGGNGNAGPMVVITICFLVSNHVGQECVRPAMTEFCYDLFPSNIPSTRWPHAGPRGCMGKWLRDKANCQNYVPADKKKGDWSNYWACLDVARNNYLRCLAGNPPVPFDPYGPDYPDERFPEDLDFNEPIKIMLLQSNPR